MGRQRDWAAEEIRRRMLREIEKQQDPEKRREGDLEKSLRERQMILNNYFTPFDLLGDKITIPKKKG